MKKTIIFLSIAVMAIGLLNSCSKTRDGLGLDAINNAVKVGKWEDVIRQVYVGSASEPVSSDNLTEGAAYATFQSDNKVHFFNSSGVDDKKPVTYSFLDTKTIIYGGNEYKIQENLAGSFKRMTLQRDTDTGREVYIFERGE